MAERLGGDSVSIKMDVTQESDWKKAVDTAIEKFGHLDVLVNNAGTSYKNKVEMNRNIAQNEVRLANELVANARGHSRGVRSRICGKCQVHIPLRTGSSATNAKARNRWSHNQYIEHWLHTASTRSCLVQ
jgi:hypothetical protein